MGLCAASFRLPSQLCGQRTLWVPWTKDDMLHCAESLSRVRLVVTPWTVALQAPLSMGFSRQAYWSGLPCPPPGGSSWTRDRTQVSHVAGGFSLLPATREAHGDEVNVINHWVSQKVRSCHWNNHTIVASRVPGVLDWTQFLSSVSLSVKCKW